MDLDEEIKQLKQRSFAECSDADRVWEIVDVYRRTLSEYADEIDRLRKQLQAKNAGAKPLRKSKRKSQKQGVLKKSRKSI